MGLAEQLAQLAQAVEECEGDGGCRATKVLRKLRESMSDAEQGEATVNIEDVDVSDETTVTRSRSVCLRLTIDEQAMGYPVIYMTCADRRNEKVNLVPGGPGRQIEPHTDGPFLTFQDARGGGLTRKQWEAFKSAGDQAWNEWEKRFAGRT